MDVEQLCQGVGLDPIVLTTPDERILSSVHYAVWREVVKQTGNENLGLPSRIVSRFQKSLMD